MSTNESPLGIARPAASRGDRVYSASDPGSMWPKNPERRAAVLKISCRAARTLLSLLGRRRTPPIVTVMLPPETASALAIAADALTLMHDRARAALDEALATIDTADSRAQCVAAIARGQAAGNNLQAAASALACLDDIRAASHRPIPEPEFRHLAARLDAALAVVAAAIPVETMIQ
jgi:hypothetical protein